jgi:uncharacterized protein (TIGR02246 family)
VFSHAPALKIGELLYAGRVQLREQLVELLRRLACLVVIGVYALRSLSNKGRCMRTKLTLGLAVLALLSVDCGISAADQAADEKTIRENADKFVEAYNRRDSKTMADMWSPDAVYIDPSTGEGFTGRENISQQFDVTFAGAEDAKLGVTIDSIEFVSPNVAIEKGSAKVSYKDFDPELTTYTAVHVKRDGKWLLDRVSESEVEPPPPSHYEQLKELEWLVGSWVDEAEDSTIQTDCEWTKNRNFMTRSFAVVRSDGVDISGMQIIAWDPAAKQIRSWVFDSDGTFAEGKWSRKDNRWLIQQVGTLPDGKKSTATNIITKVDDNSFTWQSINRAADGEVLPNVEEVLVVRNPDSSNVSVDVEVPEDRADGDAEAPTDADEPAEPAASTEPAE